MASIVDELFKIVAQQTARIEQLEGHIADLTAALKLDATAAVQATFALTENLAKLLILLADGKPKNKDAILGAIYFARPEADMPDSKIADTLVCKLRKQVKHFGIEIQTVWSAGYKLTAGLDVVRSAIEHGEIDARIRKRERERERQRRLRRAQGRKDRQSYEAGSLSRQKPWEAAGIDRATWYRHRAKGLLAANSNEVVAAARAA